MPWARQRYGLVLGPGGCSDFVALRNNQCTNVCQDIFLPKKSFSRPAGDIFLSSFSVYGPNIDHEILIQAFHTEYCYTEYYYTEYCFTEQYFTKYCYTEYYYTEYYFTESYFTEQYQTQNLTCKTCRKLMPETCFDHNSGANNSLKLSSNLPILIFYGTG